jgi:hypothetical protein
MLEIGADMIAFISTPLSPSGRPRTESMKLN